MPDDDRSVRLFSLGETKDGDPKFLPAASFKSVGAEERKDVQRWVKKNPALLGEDLLIIAEELSNWDKSSDRLDLLAIDRKAKLVVIEIKRDKTAKGQDLQAIRYASYVQAAIGSEDVVGLYRAYRNKEHGEDLSESDASEALSEFAVEGSLEDLDEDAEPRMILVSTGFQSGVTSTVLWLRNTYALDIGCVQVEPYKLQGEIVLTSNTLIPLPEAADYEMKMQSKRLKSVSKKTGKKPDYERAVAYIQSVPKGRWTTYGDVATIAGVIPRRIGGWLRDEGNEIANVYRVLDREGRVSERWKTTSTALPQTPEEVEEWLITEGINFSDGKADQDQRWRPEHWKENPQAEEPESNGSGTLSTGTAPVEPL